MDEGGGGWMGEVSLARARYAFSFHGGCLTVLSPVSACGAEGIAFLSFVLFVCFLSMRRPQSVTMSLSQYRHLNKS